MVGDLLHRLFVTQTADTVGLTGAHLLQQTQVRPVALVIADGADAVCQIGLFAVYILPQVAAAAGNGIQKQLTHQGSHWLQQLLAAQCKAVVDAAGHKAHALALGVFADSGGDGGAIEGVHGGGQRLHVGIAHGAAAQNRRKQRIIGRGFAAERRHKLGRQAAGLEFAGGQNREIDIAHDLLAIFVHCGSPPADSITLSKKMMGFSGKRLAACRLRAENAAIPFHTYR